MPAKARRCGINIDESAADVTEVTAVDKQLPEIAVHTRFVARGDVGWGIGFVEHILFVDFG